MAFILVSLFLCALDDFCGDNYISGRESFSKAATHYSKVFAAHLSRICSEHVWFKAVVVDSFLFEYCLPALVIAEWSSVEVVVCENAEKALPWAQPDSPTRSFQALCC